MWRPGIDVSDNIFDIIQKEVYRTKDKSFGHTSIDRDPAVRISTRQHYNIAVTVDIGSMIDFLHLIISIYENTN